VASKRSHVSRALVLLAPLAGWLLHPHNAFAQHPDFNGDGRADLAVNTPGETVPTSVDGFVAGAVNVLYGSAAGVTAAGDQLWTQDSGAILDQSEGGDHFGAALAWGDFNADGFDDLAIGVPAEDLNAVDPSHGAVNVLYGAANGLSSAGNQFWTENSAGVPDVAEPVDEFGAALVAGDFDGDGFDDLAIGVPGEAPPPLDTPNSGAVIVLYGSSARLSARRAQLWSQDSEKVLDVAESNDRFGSSLAAGDFDGDGFDDLSIGVQNEDLEGRSVIMDAGAVNVLYGSAKGLASAGNQFWTQNTNGVPDAAETGDFLGSSQAAGDFNGDGHDDLAIGVPREGVGLQPQAGAVNVLYGSAAGLSAAGSQLWTQNSPGIGGGAEDGDHFAESLAAGDMSGDGRDDLAVGVRFEDLTTRGNVAEDAGTVNVIYGSGAGLVSAGNQVWTQNTTGVPDAAETDDDLGAAVSVADFDGDGLGDLAAGAPGESVGAIPIAGAVIVLYGSGTALSSVGSQIWTQDSPGVLEQSEPDEEFGHELP
jgi:hypothetical protein